MLSGLMQQHIALVICKSLSEGTLAAETSLLFLFLSSLDGLLAC